MDLFKRQEEIPLNTGDTAFVLLCAVLIMIMIPGVGLFYSGLSHSKNSLYIILVGVVSLSIVAIQWVFIGYSLAFSFTSNPIIGNFKNALMLNIGSSISTVAPGIPTLAFAIFQFMFAAITPIISLGSVCTKVRLLPLCLYIFLWTTLAYDPIAYWSCTSNGWIVKFGGLDFAGGTIIHIASGVSSLTFCLYLRLKESYDSKQQKPHNPLNVFFGTLFIWFGWYGFNSGSALSANPRAAVAFISTNTAAAFGAVVFSLLKYKENNYKFSIVDLCVGALAGLIGITPGCGFVPIWASPIVGAITAVACFYGLRLKHVMRVNDSCDVFAIHGIGGIVGGLLTGIFASKDIALYNGTEIKGGWIDKNWKQVPIQMLSMLSCAAWCMAWTAIILFFMEYVLRINLRISSEKQALGADYALLTEPMFEYIISPDTFVDMQEEKCLKPLMIQESDDIKNEKLAMPTTKPSTSKSYNPSAFPSTSTSVAPSLFDLTKIEKN
ncbi:hypothetical protein BB561_003359 [Smittium simulii]|uniref:Ammonium transporter n=1 Tax=Smittium simulii TaxID=133385 RepID=A0A2T9YLQ9_9FUNG|nr:hypothetical protein BB561_003359 [Smittium simulii]